MDGTLYLDHATRGLLFKRPFFRPRILVVTVFWHIQCDNESLAMIEIGDLAMDDAAVYITLISLITASLIFLFNYWRRLPTNAHPPYVSGLPLFGNAFQVFLEGANFVHECKSKVRLFHRLLCFLLTFLKFSKIYINTSHVAAVFLRSLEMRSH